jgi:LmbE family N-acetylglucosaminyl deacetylase
MVIPRAGRMAVAVLLAAAVVSAAAVVPPPEPAGAQALGLRLRRLTNLGTVLFITAHPDDENNAVLTALSRGQGVRVALLTATRGEGGQNEIGPELGEALGVLRSEELAALHRRDGVEQYFARAYDFGYSFSVEESQAKWGRDEILADFVRVIRAVRPDVIVTLRRDGRGGGQHHQAAGRIAAIAFHAAADRVLFPPDSAGGLEPWQARRIYEGAVGMGGRSAEGDMAVETGASDTLLGTTWFDFGGRSRTLHRTQGMGAPSTESGTTIRYTLFDSEPSVEMPPGHGILDRVNTTWSRLLSFTEAKERPAVSAAVPAIEARLKEAQAAFDASVPEKTLPALRGALALVRRLREEALVGGWGARSKLEILARLEPKETDIMEAIALAHGIRFDVRADDPDVVPGQEIAVSAAVASDSPGEALKLEDVVIQAPDGWTASRTAGEPQALAAGTTATMTYKVQVGTNAAVTRPLGRRHETHDRYEVPEEERTGRIFPPAPLQARLFFTSGGVLASIDRPVAGYENDSARTVSVVPAFAPRFLLPAAVIPLGTRPRTVEVAVQHFGKASAAAVCRLETPAGWTATPAEQPLRFSRENEEVKVRFELEPPSAEKASRGVLRAVVVHGEVKLSDELRLIDYPHVEPRRSVRDAALPVRTLDVKVPADTRVGYVSGAGDRVGEALEQLGVNVKYLTAEDLAGDLSRYPTIVTGVRAYLVRPDLEASHARLMEYVKSGGHLVVQYNKVPEFNKGPYAPYPAKVSQNRITDENAPVRVLLPKHPLLNTPNAIGPADFERWVQERGLYFLDATDPQYEQLLAAADPFPENPGEKKGMLVSARVGAGRWTYVGLGLWRQVEAGVPGAYRILANLVAQPRAGQP